MIPVFLALLSMLIIGLSGISVLFPSEAMAQVSELMSEPSGIWVATGMRLLLAILLWFSAPVARTPVTFRVLAVLALAGAIFVFLIDVDGFAEIIAWYSSWPAWGLRLQSLVGVAFGVFMLWSISGKWAKS